MAGEKPLPEVDVDTIIAPKTVRNKTQFFALAGEALRREARYLAAKPGCGKALLTDATGRLLGRFPSLEAARKHLAAAKVPAEQVKTIDVSKANALAAKAVEKRIEAGA